MVAIESALAGRRVLLASPTQEQADAFWDKCKTWLADPIREKKVYKNEQRRLIELPHKGRIRAKTAWDADSLRGDYADFLVLDEYAQMKADAWNQVGAPMLLDNNGDAWFISTPVRKNHFHARYVQALQDPDGRWEAWTFTSHENPHLSEAALDEITQDMTDEDYRQEILAEFLDNEGAVFRNILPNLYAPNGDGAAAHSGHRVIIGVDWGKQHDFTAISVGCSECKRELELDRFNQIDYHFQRGRLKTIYDRWQAATVLAEQNAMGDPIIEELQRDGMTVQPFQTTASSKPPLIENLALAFERSEWQFVDDRIATAELESYERKISANTGRASYSAPDGVHDDTVMARALMLRAGAYIPFVGV